MSFIDPIQNHVLATDLESYSSSRTSRLPSRPQRLPAAADRVGRTLKTLALALCLATACSTAALAQTVTQYQENGKLIRGGEAPTAMGPELFGEQLSLYTGGVEFVQTDLSLPGNSALPVSFGRRMKVGQSRGPGWSLLQDWEPDVPHIRGLFPTNAGWRVQGGTEAERGRRCSNFPLEIMPGRFATGALVEVGPALVHMSLPGGAGQELQPRSASHTLVPAGGVPHPVVTKDGWQFSCLPGLAAGSPESGEGFLARSPDGTTYRFDWMVRRPGTQLQYAARGAAARGTGRAETPPPDAAITDYILLRDEVTLYATRITDRYGNWVDYQYSPQVPERLLKIEANDGRRISFTYEAGGSQRMQTVNDGSRMLTYVYGFDTLSEVRLPDGSAWRFGGESVLSAPAAGSTYTRTPLFPASVGRIRNLRIPGHAIRAQFRQCRELESLLAQLRSLLNAGARQEDPLRYGHEPSSLDLSALPRAGRLPAVHRLHQHPLGRRHGPRQLTHPPYLRHALARQRRLAAAA